MTLRLIVNVCPFGKVRGGAELVAHKLAVRLSLRGNTVFLVNFHEQSLRFKERVSESCFVYHFPNIRVRIIGTVFNNFLVLFLALRLKPDIIFDQGLFGIGLLARLFTRKPYVVYGRGSDVYSACNARGMKGFFRKRFAKLILLQASLALALSEDMKIRMKQILNREIKVLTNSLDLDEIEKNVGKEHVERFGTKQLLFVGNVRPVKGVEYLINAMRLVIEKEPAARLVIVGSYDSYFVKRIPRDIREKILLKGFVENNKIPGLMKGSDVFVLPSLSEGFPNVLLEAMAVGLPIVATNVGGVPELISDEENGLLVQPRSSEQLAEKILLLLNNKSLHNHISQNNLLKAKKYDVNTITSTLEGYFESIS